MSHEQWGSRVAEESRTGLDCIVASGAQKEPDAGKHEFTCDCGLRAQARGLKVIGSSEQVHVVDALAITGDEGRGSLR